MRWTILWAAGGALALFWAVGCIAAPCWWGLSTDHDVWALLLLLPALFLALLALPALQWWLFTIDRWEENSKH